MVLKCKMCGASLQLTAGKRIITCHHCDTTQTLPKVENDRTAALFDRATDLRRNKEFDKAEALYEQLLTEDNTDAEIYWSLVLCRYGVEYVEDPSGKRLPTIHRAQYTSIYDDGNYKSALRCADDDQRQLYEQEAAALNDIQKRFLAISQKEAPFDVFICYKDTDEQGRRTPDSVIATDLYHQLTREGFKVFCSRITLEKMLGTAYEPYIFAALNSAKVMIVLGTRPEHFQAVWVKNEWSRFLSLIKNGAEKLLIPAYKDMDPYRLPEEFSHLQAQDMSKIGFMQDLIHGISKLVKPEAATAAPKEDVTPLLKRTFLFLEDGLFDRADAFCEQILNADPENGQAYLAKLMIQTKTKTPDQLTRLNRPLQASPHYQKILRFGDKKLVDFITAANQTILDRRSKPEKQPKPKAEKKPQPEKQPKPKAEKKPQPEKQPKPEKQPLPPGSRRKWIALLLCLIPYTGWFGVHCFYMGRYGWGLIKLFTFNFLMFGWIVDIILIATGKFKAGNGSKLV